MSATDAINNAIDDLYRAFDDFAMPLRINACPCCIDDENIRRLLTTPLRDITSDDLSSYAASALLTVGDIEDYWYFLPRIMEISIRDDSWWPDIEVTARAIKSTKIHSWPQTKRDALISLLYAFIDFIVENGSHSRIDEWLCAIARMDIDVRPALAAVEKNSEAVLQYWRDNAECLKEGKLCNAFWDLPNEGHDVVVRWFESDSISLIYAEHYGFET